MALKERLEKLKRLTEQNKQTDWDAYRDLWKKDVSDLQNTIQYKWFDGFEKNGLMTFAINNVKRIEPFIGEYWTSILEITLVNNNYLILEPVSGVTSEYDGKLEFYMSGNINKKVSILRKINDGQEIEWIVAKSFDANEHFRLDKQQFEKIIDEWLQ